MFGKIFRNGFEASESLFRLPLICLGYRDRFVLVSGGVALDHCVTGSVLLMGWV
jgi:hypothetical protein